MDIKNNDSENDKIRLIVHGGRWLSFRAEVPDSYEEPVKLERYLCEKTLTGKIIGEGTSSTLVDPGTISGWDEQQLFPILHRPLTLIELKVTCGDVEVQRKGILFCTMYLFIPYRGFT